MRESNGELYNKYKHKQTAICWCIINCVLTAAYIGEIFKGLRTVEYAALFIAITWAPCVFFMVVKRLGKMSDDSLEYTAGIGYLMFYIFAMMSAQNAFVFVYIFPMLCILTVYCNRKLNGIVMSLALMTNIVYISNKVFVDDSMKPEDITSYEIQIACILLCTVFLWRSSNVLLLRDDMIRQLSDEAYYDALTKIHNRTYLEVLEEENRETGNYIRGAALLDIDKFKHINDQYGHKSGDICLIWIAKQLKDATKKCEGAIPIRIGGDEFVIISTSDDMAALEEVCENVVNKICNGKVVSEYGQDIKITASIGLARGAQGKTFTDIYNKVDEALYKAKSQGRNRLVTVDKDWQYSSD